MLNFKGKMMKFLHRYSPLYEWDINYLMKRKKMSLLLLAITLCDLSLSLNKVPYF